MRFDAHPAGEHPQVAGSGARRLRRFDVARTPALADDAKFVGLLTTKRPQGRAPKNRQLADALTQPEKVAIALPRAATLVGLIRNGFFRFDSL